MLEQLDPLIPISLTNSTKVTRKEYTYFWITLFWFRSFLYKHYHCMSNTLNTEKYDAGKYKDIK